MKSIFKKIIVVMLGLFFCVVLLEGGLQVEKFVLLSLREYRNRISIKQKGECRILCLGESTTILGGKSSYPSQLDDILNQRDVGIKFSVVNKGVPGTFTGEIVAQLENNLKRYNPNIVITMMGVNDFANNVPYKNIPASKILLSLKKLKTYKLVTVLWFQITNRSRKIQIYKPRDIYSNLDNLRRPDILEKQEDAFRKIIETNPENSWAYIRLGWSYWAKGEYSEAEKILTKAINVNLKDERIYIRLGMCYKKQEKYDKAEELFKKALGIAPKNDKIYIELGKNYWEEEKYVEAKEMFKRALEINPKNERAYMGLELYYRRNKKENKAKEMFERALEINAKNEWAYMRSGWHYKNQKEYNKAQKLFQKAIDINPQNEWAFVELGDCYRAQRKYDELEKLLKEAPKGKKIYGALLTFCKEQKKDEFRDEYLKKANSLRLEYYNPITRHNYQKLKKILDKKGVKLICVQYPMRSVAPLKKMLEPHKDVIFVNNEKIFKKAVKQADYDEYFEDMFGGDFGHCTPKGNKLLAGNIVQVILKEVFNK